MISFTAWFNEVTRIGTLLNHQDELDPNWWRDYFRSDMTPAEAWAEELALVSAVDD